MKKGLSDANFIPNWDTVKFLKATKEAGFEGVELNFREQGGELTHETSIVEAKRLARLVESHDLEIASLSTGLFNFYPLSSGDARLRKNGEDIGFRMIELAEAMGVDVIQVVPGVAAVDISYDAAYELAVESLSRLGDVASEAGVTIGIENVCNKFLPSPREYTGFLNEINHSSVQAYFDNGNALATGYPEHFIKLLGDRIVAMHVKDYREHMGEFVSILEGDTNWPAMMKALKDIPYEGYLIATPHYPFLHSHDSHIERYSRDLTAVLNLSTPVSEGKS
ncbi:sugar phosphate isomerase/epimerase family protein [Virgibacillus necropolis]|uniref:Xylulose 5-phosphate 3-epimerase n=1 Tax=Virgibacillus necropolis TaxID=163877 RepID=A0A221MGI3_9BACI|nr:sugar phosphate isomerase/epimerase family protein [Virgibacillus necropolis]ASN06751.1 xylulose 5-phosphate 3-epimerase [Virgibacillus necropolis]